MSHPKQLTAGQAAPAFSLSATSGETVSLDSRPKGLTLLQFHRFSGCPACNFTVRQFAQRHHELEAAGMSVIMVFHSPLDELRESMAAHNAPFLILADPDRTAYGAYAVGRSWAGIMHPRFMGKVMRGMVGSWGLPGRHDGGITGLPADFLIDAKGELGHVHYGRHAGDTFDVDETLRVGATLLGRTPREAPV